MASYLADRFPRDLTMTRVRLGSLPATELTPLLEDHEVRMMSVFRRWADYIVVTRNALILGEAAIRSQPGKISQLQLYALLLPHTPELQQYLPRRIELELLYAIEDPVVTMMANEAGIRTVFYRTKAAEEYIKLLHPRERRSPRS